MFNFYMPPRMSKLGWIVFVLAAISASAKQVEAQTPGARQSKPIALVHAHIHPVSQPSLEDATILFDGGKIIAVGKSVNLPPETTIIDASGKHIYPGLFEAHSQMGLIEISAVRATDDQSETGAMNPNAKAQIAVNPESEIIPVTRSNGVLLALSAPVGGLVSGKSAVLQLDGWTYEDMTVKSEAALQIEWPSLAEPTRGDAEERKKSRDAQQNALRDLNQLFGDAKAYVDTRKLNSPDQAYDSRLEAMIPVIDGRLPIMVHADDVAQIESAVGFAVDHNVRIILLGGYDAPLCADLLRKHKVAVIVSSVYRLPRRAHEPVDHAYTLPKRLLDAKIKFCISGSDRSETWNTRLLPYHAATAVAYGLPPDEGLRAITLYVAEILGVAEQVGSLEANKDATLIVTNGDPLETTTQFEMAFIQGRAVDLSNKQTRLYEKYREKYRRIDAESAKPNPGE